MKKEAEPFQTKYTKYLPVELQDEMHMAHELDLQGARKDLEEKEFRVVHLS